MSYKNSKSGEMRVRRGGRNRAVSSVHFNSETFSSIAIVVAIFLLAVVACIFFAFFADVSFPVWNPSGNDQPSFQNPEKTSPYATKTDKTQFVASAGGEGLGGLALSSDYAILIRVDDMTTLGYKNPDEVIYPASMTKVMTVITALDYINNLDDVYTVTKKVLNKVPYGSSTASIGIYFENGENKLTVRDLLYGVSYMSGADSVICLLDYLGLSVEEFVSLMNGKAKEIGLTNTRFGGAIGMDAENNQTTCRDMAAIMAYAMENEIARELFSGGKHPLDIIEGYSYYHSTLDTLLGRMYTSADVVLGNYTILAAKSGLEDRAGYCLVSYIRNDETGEKYVLVTAKAEKHEWPYAANPIYDMIEIFEELNP